MAEAIHIDGLAELSKLLTQETTRAAKRYLERVAIPAAQVVLDAAHSTVPVAAGVLEAALMMQKDRWATGDGESTLIMEIGPQKNYFWGSISEFGSVHQAPTHWLQRAWESSKDECLAVFETEAIALLLDLQNKKG